MKRTIQQFAVPAVALSAVLLAGCSQGPAADVQQMAAARDAQFKAMAAQRKSGVSTGAGSIAGAAKAIQQPGATGQ